MLDRPTGRTLWQVKLRSSPTSSPVLSGHGVLVADESGVELRRIVDGNVLWRSAPERGGAVGPLAVDDTRCFFVNDQSAFVVLALRDGRVLADVPGVDGGFPPLVATNGVIVRGVDGLLFAEHEHWAATLAPWCASETRAITSPAVHHGGHVYVGIDGAGLVCFGGEAP
jgi:hypothetical protein